MLIIILLLFGGAAGLGGALHVYYDIKHGQERKEREAREAKERATRKMFI